MQKLIELREKRAAKITEMRGLHAKDALEGNEETRFKALETEVQTIDGQIAREERVAEYERQEQRSETVHGGEFDRELRNYSLASAINGALAGRLADSTTEQYRRQLRVIRKVWGNLQADALRPSHVQALMEKIGAEKPGSANNLLDALRAMCRWASGPRELLNRDPTQGVAHFQQGEGHKPWTPEQLAFADNNFDGMLHRAYVLARYTGQRISDVVRLGWNDIDDGGFSLRQKKTGVQPWCPIFPELEAEISQWEKRPSPFLYQDNGKPFTPNLLWKRLEEVRIKHPVLTGAVWHGLRANAIIRLRQ